METREYLSGLGVFIIVLLTGGGALFALFLGVAMAFMVGRLKGYGNKSHA
jgi:hypothetical protein